MARSTGNIDMYIYLEALPHLPQEGPGMEQVRRSLMQLGEDLMVYVYICGQYKQLVWRHIITDVKTLEGT